MSFTERLATGAPLRIGEFSYYIGYSQTQIRKWIDAGALKAISAPFEGAERRIPVEEAERIAREMGLI